MYFSKIHREHCEGQIYTFLDLKSHMLHWFLMSLQTKGYQDLIDLVMVPVFANDRCWTLVQVMSSHIQQKSQQSCDLVYWMVIRVYKAALFSTHLAFYTFQTWFLSCSKLINPTPNETIFFKYFYNMQRPVVPHSAASPHQSCILIHSSYSFMWHIIL